MRLTNLLRSTASVAVVGAVAFGFAGVASAQSADQDGPTTIDDIIVTAQKREQNLQDVPIVVTSLSAETLEDAGVRDIKDLQILTPGLTVTSTSSEASTTARIRGVGTVGDNPGLESSVGVVIDGVYRSRNSVGFGDLGELSRIEVLKGPQGTLFGRNTAAGAISLITRRPQPEFEARASMRLGNYGKRYLDGMLNIPTGESSALRINALSNKSDGWIQDGATGKDLNGDNVWATRAAWELRIGDDTTMLLSWDHEDLDQNGRVSTGIVPLPAFPRRPGAPADPGTYLDPRDLQTFSDTDVSDEARLFDGVNLIIDHDTDWGTLTSTTSWRQYDSNNWTEEDGTNRADLYVDSQNTESNETWYQELKLRGFNDRFDWVVGASWFKEDAYQTSEVNTNTTTIGSILANQGFAAPPGFPFAPEGTPLLFVMSQIGQGNGLPSLLGHGWNEVFQNTLRTSSYAAFGDVIWHATDKLNLTFGLRYTRDEKRFSWLNEPRTAATFDPVLNAYLAAGIPQMFLGDLPPEVAGQIMYALTTSVAFIDPPAIINKGTTNRARKSWSDWSPRLVVDYHFSDTGMVFASLAKGYKAGGYNALQIGSNFDNENVWNFEAGIKQSLGDFAYNASLFRYNYDNRQAVRLIDPDPNNPSDIPRYVVDSGDLEAWGVEADAQWQVSKAFTLSAAMAWIDSTYKDYTTLDGMNLDGQPTGEPYFNASLGAVYVAELGDSGRLRFSARHAYRGATRCNTGSGSQGDCGQYPLFRIGESRQRTDLRVSWTSPQDRWTVAAYGNNVFDKRYVTGLNTYGAAVLGVVGAGVTAPRTYGLEVTLKY